MTTHAEILQTTAGRTFTADVTLHFPAIYKARPNPGGREWFQVSVDASDISSIVRRGLYNGLSKNHILIKSTIPPQVFEKRGRYSKLATLFSEADVRNVPRDRLLNGTSATIEYKVRGVTYPTPTGMTETNILVLNRVTIDLDQLRFPE